MSKLVQSTLTKDTITTNGMATNSTSLNSCLDLFFIAGASRTMSDEDIQNAFVSAYSENKEIALRILFWARDVRGGAGERRFFRVVLSFISENYPEISRKISSLVPEYGRWDDIFSGDREVAIQTIQKALSDGDGLCAKWMPRKGEWFNTMRKSMGLTPKEYRKLLVNLTKVIETQMCNNEFDKINYEQVPSVAFNKYSRAFCRKDSDRFGEFINKASKGEAKINASAIFPHDITKNLTALKHKDSLAQIEQWNQLPNYMENSNERIIPVCDVSGSMSGLPMEVSVSLGMYISERNEGIFKDAFITFSADPKMQYLKGDVWERAMQLRRAEWGMNTNLEATFDLILNSAIKNNLPENEMPTKILIISDMEFDECTSSGNNYWNNTNEFEYNQTALEMIEEKYLKAGYQIPGIIFWNVNGRLGNIPVKAHDKNTALISGFSPAILTSILGDGDFNPTQVMLDTVNKERYNLIEQAIN